MTCRRGRDTSRGQFRPLHPVSGQRQGLGGSFTNIGFLQSPLFVSRLVELFRRLKDHISHKHQYDEQKRGLAEDEALRECPSARAPRGRGHCRSGDDTSFGHGVGEIKFSKSYYRSSLGLSMMTGDDKQPQVNVAVDDAAIRYSKQRLSKGRRGSDDEADFRCTSTFSS